MHTKQNPLVGHLGREYLPHHQADGQTGTAIILHRLRVGIDGVRVVTVMIYHNATSFFTICRPIFIFYCFDDSDRLH